MVVEGEGYRLIRGDCLEVMRTFADNTFDTVTTDPPAGIAFMGKKWDSNKGGRDRWIAWLTEVMAECLRVAKPGAMLLCWSIPRTSHWTGMAIEQAGWQVRDVVTHLFGSGFPKSMAIDKAIDKAAGAEREVIGVSPNSRFIGNRMYANGGGLRGHDSYEGDLLTAPATDAAKEWNGWGTALKPAAEFWWLAMKPLEGTFAENAMAHGVVGLNIDGCRVGADGESLDRRNGGADSLSWGGTYGAGMNEAALRQAQGLPAQGRWPANLILDKEAARLLDEMSGESKSKGGGGFKSPVWTNSTPEKMQKDYGDHVGYLDTGGASRFFYTAKASRSERDAGLEGIEKKVSYTHNHEARDMSNPKNAMGNGERARIERGESSAIPRANTHPTVKPLDLMRYLVRLTKTPRGGTVLDPFMGSGSTGVACMIEGRQFVGIDKEPEYVEIARHRLEHWRDEVSTEPRRITDSATHTDLPLFAEQPT